MPNKLESLVGSRFERSAGSIDFAATDASGARTEVSLNPAMVPLLITALARHLAEAQAALPVGSDLQQIQVTGLTPAMNAEGQRQLLLTLEGGAQIALSLRMSDLSKWAKHLRIQHVV